MYASQHPGLHVRRHLGDLAIQGKERRQVEWHGRHAALGDTTEALIELFFAAGTQLVLGDREQEAGEVGVREHRAGDTGAVAVDDFLQRISDLITTRSLT